MSGKRSHLIRELFTRNKRDLLAYFTRRVGRDAAPDLLQETFARALRYNQFEAVADPPAFLQQIAINLTRDFGRRRKIESSIIEFGRLPAGAPSLEAPPEEKIEFERQSRRLRAATETLPPRCREVFVLCIHENLPPDEIAQRLGISENMVRKHLRRAVLLCRAAVE